MVISTDDELVKLKAIGRICALALQTMADALEPGITTAELDAIGRKVLDDPDARSAPEFCYDFPAPPASASTKRWRMAFRARASSWPAIWSTSTCLP